MGVRSGFWVLSTVLSVARACVLMGLDRGRSCGVSRKKTGTVGRSQPRPCKCSRH